MAVRTISNAGGNFNATTAWVGNVVPVTGDSILATEASGNLTININTPVLSGADLSLYKRTLALGTSVLNVGGNLTLGSNMAAITNTTGRINISVINSILTSNEIIIPTINFSNNTVLAGDLQTNSIFGMSGIISGGSLIFLGSTINVNNYGFSGTSRLILRPVGALALSFGGNGMNGILQIDTTNTITLSGYMRLDGSNNSLEITKNVTFSSPTLNPRLLYSKATNNVTSISAGTYSFNFTEIVFQGSANTATLNINSDSISVENLIIDPSGFGSSNTVTSVSIQGTYPFSNIKSLYCQSYFTYWNGGTSMVQKSSSLSLKGGFTYSVSENLFIGGSGIISSSLIGKTPSVANIYFTGLTYSITNAFITNLNFVSTEVTLKYLENTDVSLVSTTGISLASGGGGGVAGGSFTFVN